MYSLQWSDYLMVQFKLIPSTIELRLLYLVQRKYYTVSTRSIRSTWKWLKNVHMKSCISVTFRNLYLWNNPVQLFLFNFAGMANWAF